MNDLEVLVLNQGFNKLAGLKQWGNALDKLFTLHPDDMVRINKLLASRPKKVSPLKPIS